MQGLETSLAGAAVLDSLGYIYVLRAQAIEAEPLYKEVLRIYGTVVGETHPAVARTFHSLAIVYQDLGQYDEAEQFYEKAIEILTRSFGPINASVAATRLERVLLLTERGASDEAIEEARAALSVYEQLKGPWEIKQGYATVGAWICPAPGGQARCRGCFIQSCAATHRQSTRGSIVGPSSWPDGTR